MLLASRPALGCRIGGREVRGEHLAAFGDEKARQRLLSASEAESARSGPQHSAAPKRLRDIGELPKLAMHRGLHAATCSPVRQPRRAPVERRAHQARKLDVRRGTAGCLGCRAELLATQARQLIRHGLHGLRAGKVRIELAMTPGSCAQSVDDVLDLHAPACTVAATIRAASPMVRATCSDATWYLSGRTRERVLPNARQNSSASDGRFVGRYS